MNIQTIEQEVLQLPIEDRARLAEKLLSSLDDLSEQEVEKLWLVEAQRRATEIDNGAVQLVSSEEMERRIQAILKWFIVPTQSVTVIKLSNKFLQIIKLCVLKIPLNPPFSKGEERFLTVSAKKPIIPPFEKAPKGIKGARGDLST